MGLATVGRRHYEVGIIQTTPIPLTTNIQDRQYIVSLSIQTHDLVRTFAKHDETTHVFCLPVLLYYFNPSLTASLQAIIQAESKRQSALADLQAQIDSHVAELYGVPELDEGSIEQPSFEEGETSLASEEAGRDEQDDGEVPGANTILHPPSLIADLLSWCIGAAFGRWDVRYALHPESLPPLPGPFDPLPVCSPGMLVGSDGLPLSSSPDGYPLPVAWDGFLVDDPGHPRDIVAAVRGVLRLLWQEQAEAIEAEACQILNVSDLRTWLHDSKGFFAYHIKRYSKSRRKAPIYWLLQSAKGNYGIWLYYPRLNPGSLFRAGREYADAKLNLETDRLNDLQNGLAAAAGSARKIQERKIAVQTALVAEMKAFQKSLDAAALLELKPDLNDGVLLNIAPLHELVPWKEADRAWEELLRGKYEWSSIGKWLRQKGLV